MNEFVHRLAVFRESERDMRRGKDLFPGGQGENNQRYILPDVETRQYRKGIEPRPF